MVGTAWPGGIPGILGWSGLQGLIRERCAPGQEMKGSKMTHISIHTVSPESQLGPLGWPGWGRGYLASVLGMLSLKEQPCRVCKAGYHPRESFSPSELPHLEGAIWRVVSFPSLGTCKHRLGQCLVALQLS